MPINMGPFDRKVRDLSGMRLEVSRRPVRLGVGRILSARYTVEWNFECMSGGVVLDADEETVCAEGMHVTRIGGDVIIRARREALEADLTAIALEHGADLLAAPWVDALMHRSGR